MDLLIKNTNLPKHCSECDYSWGSFREGLGCAKVDRWLDDNNSKLPDCPLSEVPSTHGNLIDLDAYVDRLETIYCGEHCTQRSDCAHCQLSMCIRIAKSEPVLVKASKSK